MSLSQKQFHDFKKVCEEFYEPTEDLNEELFDDICDELIDELIEEGYSEEDAVLMIEDAANDYIDEAKVTFGHDTQAKRASGAPVGGGRRFAMRKAGDAMKKAGDLAWTPSLCLSPIRAAKRTTPTGVANGRNNIVLVVLSGYKFPPVFVWVPVARKVMEAP